MVKTVEASKVHTGNVQPFELVVACSGLFERRDRHVKEVEVLILRLFDFTPISMARFRGRAGWVSMTMSASPSRCGAVPTW